jgi:hypothetical protein
MDRREANLNLIRQAEEDQDATKEGIFRIQRTLQETEQIGGQTLEELRKQGSQMDDINNDLDRVSNKLDQSSALQATFDSWAGNWFGGKKKQALKEAAAEIAQRDKEDAYNIKELFEHETYTSMSRTWKSAGMVLTSDPTVSAPNDIFDPASQGPESSWMIDYSLTGIDVEGWTYAYDFVTLNKSGAGKPAADWNCYVRRRKWRFNDKRAAENPQIAEVRERNQQRLEKLKPKQTQAEKIGYVPRAQQAKMQASGMVSSRMANSTKEEELDPESAEGLAQLKANDREIDQGLDQISGALDRLANISSAMNSETKQQNDKLTRIDTSMSRTADKTTVVNSRQKHLLK